MCYEVNTGWFSIGSFFPFFSDPNYIYVVVLFSNITVVSYIQGFLSLFLLRQCCISGRNDNVQ